jgi:peptidoglycan/LPS O-acetylase OafA/YrhL
MQAYRADIDGLRAVAVGTVLAYHAGAGWLPGGFVGVDVFFVISGYLITSIVARDARAGSYSLLGFYERRARRIFPALFAMLAATAMGAWALLPPDDLKLFGESLGAAILFVSNMQMMGDAGYFAGAAETRPLLHTWSLAVEEQFYIVFPPLLAWLIMRRPRLALPVLIAGTLLSFAACVIATPLRPTMAFYLAPLRAWELSAGAILALAPVLRLPRGASAGLGAVGLGLILFAAFRFGDATDFPGAAAAIPVLGAVAIILAGGAGGGPVSRLLASAPLRGIGLISYSLYLWHWPVIVLQRYWTVRPPTLPETLAAVALSLLLAWASWRFIERPFRGHGTFATRRGALTAAGGLMAGGLAVAAVVIASGGAPSRFSPAALQTLSIAADRPSFADCARLRPANPAAGHVCPIGAPGAADFAVWGDSHATALAPAFDVAARAGGRSGALLRRRGCPPLLGLSQTRAPYDNCPDFTKAALAHLDAHPGIRTVILVGRWALYAEGERFGEELGPEIFLRDDQSLRRTTAENRAVFARAARRTFDALEARGLHVVVVGQAPGAEVNVPAASALALRLGRDLDFGAELSAYEARQSHVRAVFGPLVLRAGAQYLPLADSLCAGGRCRVADARGLPIYADSNHLTAAAARGLAGAVSALLPPLRPDAG